MGENPTPVDFLLNALALLIIVGALLGAWLDLGKKNRGK